MRVLVTGSSGQLGKALTLSAPSQILGKPLEVILTSRKGCMNQAIAFDITNLEECEKVMQALKPDWLINAAAYTLVDQAESDKLRAYLVNATGPSNLAQLARKHGTKMLHISTDFVFSGDSDKAYKPSDKTDPLSTYGRTKLVGEQLVLDILQADSCILRTSWLYSSSSKNFVLTILRLLQERNSINVVADQYGSPTASQGLAKACWQVVREQANGIHHWSDSGVISWYDFAQKIREIAISTKLVSDAATINPIPSSAYPLPAKRPNYSSLDCSKTACALGLHQRPWNEALSSVLAEIENNKTIL